MTFEVRLSANAQRDFDRHVGYFRSVPELAGRILDLDDDLLQALDFIASHPLLHREIYPGVRHEALRRFRYHGWFRTYPSAEFADVFAILQQAADSSQIEARLR